MLMLTTVLFTALPLGGGSARAEAFGPNTIADAAEKVTPAVVNITTERKGKAMPQGHPFGPLLGPQPRRQMGAGSGVVISPDGYIVTNNHVIEGADEIKVVLADKREFEAELIGTDKPSDLALIRIPAKKLPHVSFGDSSKLRLGEFVLAVGNPFGVGQTVTMGIVSAKGRANIGIVDYEDFIQTDAAINPGNSGGALVNLEGELVGINTAILSRSGGAQGIGFAVPASMARPILDQIRAHGRVRRGWLGVAIQDLTQDLATTLDLEGVRGVLISDVMDGSPADEGEMKAGDVVTSVNGKPTRNAAQLRNTIALTAPGSTARLEVLRDGKKVTLNVKLGEKEGEEGPEQQPEAESSLISGLELRDIDRDARRELRLPRDLEGVVVARVARDSAAEEAGLRPGDVITRVGRKRVRDMDDLKGLEREDAKQALLRVWRRGRYLFLVLKR